MTTHNYQGSLIYRVSLKQQYQVARGVLRLFYKRWYSLSLSSQRREPHPRLLFQVRTRGTYETHSFYQQHLDIVLISLWTPCSKLPRLHFRKLPLLLCYKCETHLKCFFFSHPATPLSSLPSSLWIPSPSSLCVLVYKNLCVFPRFSECYRKKKTIHCIA